MSTHRLVKKLWMALRWRLCFEREFCIYVAGPLSQRPEAALDHELLRLSLDRRDGLELARDAILAAGDADDLERRLENGQEFFAWIQEGRVVSFGWIGERDRMIGVRPGRPRPGRVFLFKFHTLPAHRGRCLYPMLLRHMRFILSQEGKNEFIIEAYSTNHASLRGIEKAGFDLFAHSRVWTWLTFFSFERSFDYAASSAEEGDDLCERPVMALGI